MNWNQRKGKLPLERYLVSCLAALSICCGAWATEPAASPREQLKQLTAKLQQSPDDGELREKIIKLSLSLKPSPKAPEDVAELKGQAAAAFNQADFADSIEAYQKALDLAPWAADLYFNLGLAQEKAGQPQEAVQNLQFYLLAAPKAADAEAVRERIGGLKYAAKKRREKGSSEMLQKPSNNSARYRYDYHDVHSTGFQQRGFFEIVIDGQSATMTKKEQLLNTYGNWFDRPVEDWGRGEINNQQFKLCRESGCLATFRISDDGETISSDTRFVGTPRGASTIFRRLR